MTGYATWVSNPYEEQSLRNAWTLGERAGYRDANLGECPFAPEMMPRRIAWYEGHAEGTKNASKSERARQAD